MPTEDLFAGVPLTFKMNDLVRIVDHEIGMRQEVYPRRVSRDLMTVEAMRIEIAGMQKIKELLVSIIHREDHPIIAAIYGECFIEYENQNHGRQ